MSGRRQSLCAVPVIGARTARATESGRATPWPICVPTSPHSGIPPSMGGSRRRTCPPGLIGVCGGCALRTTRGPRAWAAGLMASVAHTARAGWQGRATLSPTLRRRWRRSGTPPSMVSVGRTGSRRPPPAPRHGGVRLGTSGRRRSAVESLARGVRSVQAVEPHRNATLRSCTPNSPRNGTERAIVI